MDEQIESAAAKVLKEEKKVDKAERRLERAIGQVEEACALADKAEVKLNKCEGSHQKWSKQFECAEKARGIAAMAGDTMRECELEVKSAELAESEARLDQALLLLERCEAERDELAAQNDRLFKIIEKQQKISNSALAIPRGQDLGSATPAR